MQYERWLALAHTIASKGFPVSVVHLGEPLLVIPSVIALPADDPSLPPADPDARPAADRPAPDPTSEPALAPDPDLAAQLAALAAENEQDDDPPPMSDDAIPAYPPLANLTWGETAMWINVDGSSGMMIVGVRDRRGMVAYYCFICFPDRERLLFRMVRDKGDARSDDDLQPNDASWIAADEVERRMEVFRTSRFIGTNIGRSLIEAIMRVSAKCKMPS